MKLVTIEKLEMQFANLQDSCRRHPHFFLCFPNGGGQSSLAVFQSSAGSVDLASAQPPFLVNQKNLTLPNHKTKGRLLCRLPA